MHAFRTLLLGTLSFPLAFCTPKSSSPSDQRFVVLTYSSMTGKGSLGEFIEQRFEEECRKQSLSACDLVLQPEDGDSSLVSTYLARPANFHAVLGLETLQLAQLQSKSKISKSQVFARSPHAFIVDTHVWKDPSRWPRSWKDLKKFPSSAFIQDPRVSAVGIGWVKAIFAQNLIDLPTAKLVTKKVFPSWSLSYSAFQKGGAPLVWSYQSSEAYHRCEEKTDRYKALPLLEGYPVQEEFAVLVPQAPEKEGLLFMTTLVSDDVQAAIPLKNWMWPVVAEISLPECFSQVTPLRALKDHQPELHSQSLREWTDKWSL